MGGIILESTTDYPNLSAAVINMGKCNFACHYCFDYDIVDPLLCKKRDTAHVFEEVMDGRELIDAVVFTGAEPTQQRSALAELCFLFKNEGLKSKIDTNGSDAGILSELLIRKLVDYIALDVKAPLEHEKEYAHVIGLPSAKKEIHSIGEILLLHGAFDFTLECRTTIVPTLIYRPHEIEQIAKEIAGHCNLYVLQQFIPDRGCLDPAFSEIAAPNRDELAALASHAKKYIKDVRIRTAEFGEEKI